MKILTPDLVDLTIKANCNLQVIDHLANKIDDCEGRLNDCDGFIEDVLSREQLTSTAIGFGVAIPHGKSACVDEVTVAFGRLDEGIEWESFDGEKVDLVFLLAIPEECKGDQHLKLIACLSRKLIHEEFRESLRAAQDVNEIMELLDETLNTAKIA